MFGGMGFRENTATGGFFVSFAAFPEIHKSPSFFRWVSTSSIRYNNSASGTFRIWGDYNGEWKKEGGSFANNRKTAGGGCGAVADAVRHGSGGGASCCGRGHGGTGAIGYPYFFCLG